MEPEEILAEMLKNERFLSLLGEEYRKLPAGYSQLYRWLDGQLFPFNSPVEIVSQGSNAIVWGNFYRNAGSNQMIVLRNAVRDKDLLGKNGLAGLYTMITNAGTLIISRKVKGEGQ